MDLMEHPLFQGALSLVLLAAIAPLVIRVFRGTWARLDAEALEARQRQVAAGAVDYRAPLTLVLGAISLTLIHNFGDRETFDRLVLPALHRWQAAGGPVDVATYHDLLWRIYWGLCRYAGYLLPLALWPLFFRKDDLLDYAGLRGRGFREHVWIYVLCIAVIIPTLVAAARFSDFARVYPMYKTAHRSWLDFAVWEVVYLLQFFVLEVFFRGFWLRGARSLGSGAIFSMVVPYVMIHYTKPYLEACGAVIAGTVLGSLSMKTRSIYAGFLVHVTVALAMDLVSLERRDALPTLLTPTSTTRLAFPYLSHVLWGVWALSLVYLGVLLWRRRAARAPVARPRRR